MGENFLRGILLIKNNSYFKFIDLHKKYLQSDLVCLIQFLLIKVSRSDEGGNLPITNQSSIYISISEIYKTKLSDLQSNLITLKT